MLIADSPFLFAAPLVYLQFTLPHPLFKKKRPNVIGASPLIIQ